MLKGLTLIGLLGLVRILSAAPIVDFDDSKRYSKQDGRDIVENLLTNLSPSDSDLQPQKSMAEGISVIIAIKSASGEWVVQQPEHVDGKAVYYVFPPGSEVKTTLGCNTSNPNPTPNYWRQSISYRNFPSYGGHPHSNPLPPNLQQPSGGDLPNPALSPILPVNTYFDYFWNAPAYATRITQEAKSMYACQSTIVLVNDIKISGLVPLPAGAGYVLTGETSWHPINTNHYVAPHMKTALQELGMEWRSTCLMSDTLKYNDMSLIWGGLFDLNHNWRPPHAEHRFGNNADVSKKWVRKGNREKLVRMMCKYAQVYSEGDGVNEAPHYHLTLRSSPHTEDFPDPFDTKYIYCCPSPTPNVPPACINLENSGNPQQEDLPVETDCP